MHKEMHVAIITDREYDERLKKEIEGIAYDAVRLKVECALYDRSLDYVIDNKPNILLMRSAEPHEKILSVIGQIIKVCTTTNVVVCIEDMDPDFLVKAFRLGVKDVLAEPFDIEQFKKTVGRIASASLQVKDAKQECHAINVFSNKGGVGVTTIAVNLAVALAKQNSDKKVLLCDFVLEHGDVPIFMRKTADNYSIVDFISDMNRLDSKLIENSLTRDEESGLYLLLGPANPEDADYIAAEQLKSIMALLKKTFDLIVIDLSHDFSDKNIVLMDECDMLFLVMALDLPSIKNVARCLEIFKKLRYDRNKVRLIVNRSNSKDQIEMNLVADKLEYPIAFSLPNDYKQVVNSINAGVPVAYNKKTCNFAKEIYNMVANIEDTFYKKK